MKLYIIKCFIFKPGYVPKYRCSVPACESAQNATYYENNEIGLTSAYVIESIGKLDLGKHACKRKVAIDKSASCQEVMDWIQDNDNDKLTGDCGNTYLVSINDCLTPEILFLLYIYSGVMPARRSCVRYSRGGVLISCKVWPVVR